MRKQKISVKGFAKTVPAGFLLAFFLAAAGCAGPGGFIAGNRAEEKTVRLTSLLPGRALGANWEEKMLGDYFPGNLYNYVDGEAELYLSYQFQELAAASYFLPGDEKNAVTVEVFRMGSKLDAFGVYSNYRPAGAEPLPVGAGGFAGESALLFYQDRYFVKVLGTGDEAADRGMMLNFARLVENNLPGDKEPPPELNLIKVSCLDQGTIRYLSRGLLGYSIFPPALEAECRLGEEKARIFVVISPGESKAYSVFWGYQKMLKDVYDRGENWFSGIDTYHGDVLVGRQGKWIAGVVGRIADEKRKELLTELLAELK